uniref:Uncharacterized protein n=1 Tax=Rhipicephalus zambeziensis TaxID=60191 RepID=A0A224YDP6_9ACAR
MSVSEQDDLAALGCILGHLFNAMKTEDGANLIRLQGILSQLPRSVLGPYSVYRDTMRLFAKQFPYRIVLAKDKVYTSAGLWEKHFGQQSREPAPQQHHLTSGDPPAEVHNVAGKVSKLLMLYGFVDLEPPHRVSIFFDKRFFDGNRHYDLTKSWLKVGDHVLLNAVRSPPGYRAKYQATRIEVAKKMKQNPAPSRMSSETDGGVIYGCPGTIQAVKPSPGFTLFGQDNKHCTYLIIDNVDKSLLKPGKNLDDILKAGSKVQFNAQPESQAIHLFQVVGH